MPGTGESSPGRRVTEAADQLTLVVGNADARAAYSSSRVRLAVDSHGDVYVGEVSWTAWPQIYPGKPHPADLRSLQKFEKVE